MKYLLVFVLAITFISDASSQIQKIEKPKVTPKEQKQVDPGIIPVYTPPSKVGFSARINNGREILTGDKFNNFDQVLFNDANGFNASTGVFTAPAQGYYSFMFNITLLNYTRAGEPIALKVSANKNNSLLETFDLPVYYRDGYSTQSFTLFAQLAKDDKISLNVQNAVSVSGGRRPAYKNVVFSGYRIH